MTIQAHLTELERRHQKLEDEIAEAMAHPSSDGLKIAELKRQKLQVKDEITRLKGLRQHPLRRRSCRLDVRVFAAGSRHESRRCYSACWVAAGEQFDGQRF